MIDDIRILVPVEPGALSDCVAFSPDGTHKRCRKVKLRDKHDLTIRVKPVKKGTAVVLEGSFAGFLQGHAICGPTDLQGLVEEGVSRCFHKLDLPMSRQLRRNLGNGSIRLERVDVVGFVDCKAFGGVSNVLRVLDVAYAGTLIPRMVYPEETVLLDASSRSSSFAMYHKGRQMRAVHPAIWESLDERLQRFSDRYVRCEKRYLLPALQDVNVEKVRDFKWAQAKVTFNETLRDYFNAAQFPRQVCVPVGTEMDKTDLVAALALCGANVTTGMKGSTLRRIKSEIEDRYKFDVRRPVTNADPAMLRSIEELRSADVHFGAPTWATREGLIWQPEGTRAAARADDSKLNTH